MEAPSWLPYRGSVRVVVAATIVALIAGACSDAASEPQSEATSSTPVSAETNTLAVTEEPTTPLFAGARGETWRRAWVELDVETLARFFADGAVINGAAFDRAMADARARHPDPMQWVETYEDCIHHSSGHVTCDVRWTSAMYRPAGLDIPVHRSVYFDDDGLISLYKDEVRFDAVTAFEISIAEWLAKHHPEIAPVDWETDDYSRYAETVRGVLTVVDEFVASSDDYPPGTRRIDEPVLSGTVEGIDVYNANDVQISLVAWARDRFVASGLDVPPATHVTFPPTSACESGFSGMSFHTDLVGHIEVCTTAETFATSAAAAPLTARRTILHELGHLWIAAYTDEATRRKLTDHLGLTDWTGVEWSMNGSEMAAEILMWGLIDEELAVRVPGASCEERVTAFALLVGSAPPMRSCG